MHFTLIVKEKFSVFTTQNKLSVSFWNSEIRKYFPFCDKIEDLQCSLGHEFKSVYNIWKSLENMLLLKTVGNYC